MDLDMAMNEIRQMREGFVAYVNEQNSNEQVAEITDILNPQKFIERHFGDEDPDFLFQEVLKEVPEPIIQPKEEPVPQQDEEQNEHIEEIELPEQPVSVPEEEALWEDKEEADPPAPIADQMVAAQGNNLITGET